MHIIGIYTPIGRCLQTTFSLTLGQMLAKKYKTLYLNFEAYSGFSKILNKRFENDISDLMYYFECAREKLAYRLESMVETVNGLDFVPPVEIYQNLAGIRGCSRTQAAQRGLRVGNAKVWNGEDVNGLVQQLDQQMRTQLVKN